MYYDRNRGTKKKILIVIVILVLAGVSFFAYKELSNKDNGFILKGNGRIEGRETAVATKFSGRIVELNVDEGDAVKKGDLLAVIDSRSLEADIESQKARAEEITKQIIATDADIRATKSDIKFYKRELDRSKTLVKQNFSSQLELDTNENNLEKSEAKLVNLEATKKDLEASHKALLASIKSQEIDLGDMKIYAPVDGVILYKLVEDGEMLSDNGKMFIMYNPDDLYMTVYMSSEKAGQVKLGESAIIKLDAYPNKTFPAKVTFVADNAEFTPKEVETQEERQKLVFRVKLTLDDNSLREAKPGMPGDGYIKLNKNEPWPAYLK